MNVGMKWGEIIADLCDTFRYQKSGAVVAIYILGYKLAKLRGLNFF